MSPNDHGTRATLRSGVLGTRAPNPETVDPMEEESLSVDASASGSEHSIELTGGSGPSMLRGGNAALPPALRGAQGGHGDGGNIALHSVDDNRDESYSSLEEDLNNESDNSIVGCQSDGSNEQF